MDRRQTERYVEWFLWRQHFRHRTHVATLAQDGYFGVLCATCHDYWEPGMAAPEKVHGRGVH